MHAECEHYAESTFDRTAQSSHKGNCKRFVYGAARPGTRHAPDGHSLQEAEAGLGVGSGALAAGDGGAGGAAGAGKACTHTRSPWCRRTLLCRCHGSSQCVISGSTVRQFPSTAAEQGAPGYHSLVTGWLGYA